jgi:hypothetical protein
MPDLATFISAATLFAYHGLVAFVLLLGQSERETPRFARVSTRQDLM